MIWSKIANTEKSKRKFKDNCSKTFKLTKHCLKTIKKTEIDEEHLNKNMSSLENYEY